MKLFLLRKQNGFHFSFCYFKCLVKKTGQLHDFPNKYYRWNSYLNLKQYNVD